MTIQQATESTEHQLLLVVESEDQKADLIAKWASEMIDNKIVLEYRDGLHRKVMHDYDVALLAMEGGLFEMEVLAAVEGDTSNMRGLVYAAAVELITKHYDSIIEILKEAEVDDE